MIVTHDITVTVALTVTGEGKTKHDCLMDIANKLHGEVMDHVKWGDYHDEIVDEEVYEEEK